MTDDLKDIRQRQDRLEVRFATLEATVAEEKGLRAAMDRDASALQEQFRVQRELLQSLAITQSDHTMRLTRVETKVDRLETKVDCLETGMGDLREKMGIVQVGVKTIVELLSDNN